MCNLQYFLLHLPDVPALVYNAALQVAYIDALMIPLLIFRPLGVNVIKIVHLPGTVQLPATLKPPSLQLFNAVPLINSHKVIRGNVGVGPLNVAK